MARKLENWINTFLDFTSAIPSPEMFKKWGAISCIAAVLEQRVWVDVGMGMLYPNLYTILVAPPGVGKTVITSLVWDFWNHVAAKADKDDGLHVAPASVTSAAIIDSLRDANRKIYAADNPLEPIKFNSLAICSNELGVLLPSYDADMMNKLTDIYDGHSYSERRRYDKNLNFSIDSPQLNLLGATTPGYLTNMLPEGAWDQGFLSRTLLVFSGERVIRPLFEFAPEQKLMRTELRDDIAHIFTLNGQITFEEDMKAAINAWHSAGGPPVPDHPRLANYNSRRTAHLLKLCMVACCAATDTLVVTMNHFNTALDWLLEAEMLMPDIFKAMVVNADMKAMDECWHFAYGVFMKENRPIAEHRLVAFLSERVPVHNVMRMLDVMVNATMLKKEIVGDVGNAYRPKPRKRM